MRWLVILLVLSITFSCKEGKKNNSSTTKKVVEIDVPSFNIELTQKHLDTILQHQQLAKKRKLSLKADKHYLPAQWNNQAIKIQLHGSSRANWSTPKYSLSFKLAPDSLYKNTIRFSLITPSHQNYIVPYFANKIAELLNLPYSRQELVKLSINDEQKGLFFWDEKIHKHFLSINNIDGFIIKYTDNVINNNFYGGNLAFHDIANLKPAKNDQQKKVYFQYQEWLDAVRSTDLETTKSNIDLDQWARYAAYRTILGVSHDIMFRNQFIYYNYETKTFAPIVRSEGDLEEIYFGNGTYQKSLNDYQYLNFDNDWINKMLVDLDDDQEFVLLKFKYLKSIIDQKEEILNYCKDTKNHFHDALINDPFDFNSDKERLKILNKAFPILKRNISKVEKHIQEAIAYINIIETSKKVRIEIIPDSEIPFTVQFNKMFEENGEFFFNLYKDGDHLHLGKGLKNLNDAFLNHPIIIRHEDFKIKRTKYELIVSRYHAEKINAQIEAKNCITGEQLIDSKLNIGHAIK